MRVLQLSRSGTSLRVATSSVLLERMTGLYALVLSLMLMSPLVWPILPEHRVVISVLALEGLITVVFVGLAFVDPVVPRWRRLDVLMRFFAVLWEDYRALLKNWRNAANLLLLGAVSWLLNLVAIYVIAEGVGVDVPITACLFIAGLSVLASVVPVSLAGWGVREGAMVMLFGLMDVPAEQVMSVSLSIGILMLMAALPAGPLMLMGYTSNEPRPR